MSLSSTTIHSERTRASAHAAVNTRFAEPYCGQTRLSGSSAYSTPMRVQSPAGLAVDPETGARRDGEDRRVAVAAAELTDALAQEQRL